ncbi:GAF and ANTAR domain-containing protein [Streptomyces albiaxialis]|uniref:GAF and ANTAR domain-containing protein n=1 Tax=Streptomyces albiaxialis TaxID=329523 RepID=A0ABP5I6H2_9ACTN
MGDGPWEELAVRLADMARTLLGQDSVQETLDQIVRHAVSLVGGCEQAGILVVEGWRDVRTLAATSELVHASDRLQQETGQGPCFDATRRKTEVFRIADMNASLHRWPKYAPRARRLGIGSVMGFLLFTDDDNLGALDMYSTRRRAFTERSERVGWLLASHAAVALASARTHAQLGEALETRNEIGEALGIVMERYTLTEEQAFAVLRRSSQDRNVKLRDIARTVARTGEIPGAAEGPPEITAEA